MVYSVRKHRVVNISALLLSLLITLVIGAIIAFPLISGEDYGPGYPAALLAGAAILFTGLFLFFSRKYRKRKKIISLPFPHAWETILTTQVAYYSALNETEKSRFRQQVRIFLGEKQIIPIETDLDEKTRLLVAASAIIPVFSFPEWEYDNLSEILIYPANFDLNYDFQSNKANILGLVTTNGSTMILSKSSLEHGFAIDNDKRNVGFHEFVHKVDGQDGAIDGIPGILADRKLIPRWLEIIKQESAAIEKGHSDINPYGLTNNAEFFAVVSEYFFENPESMSNKHPQLYKILKEIYRQDTKSKFKSIVKSMFRPYGKKLGRNSPCPCGSGKKYKYCCLDKKIF